MKYISHYPEPIQDQAKALIETGRLNDYLHQKYPKSCDIQSDKAFFYQLCCHMQPEYHQVELDMRLWLLWWELTAKN